MFGLSKTAKIMMLSVGAVCVVFLAAGIVIINLLEYFTDLTEIEGNLDYALGLALGGAVSAVKVVMMEKSLGKIADAGEGKQAKSMAQLYSVGRMFLTVAVMALGAVVPFFGLFGTIAGVVSLRFAAYVTVAVENSIEKKNADDKQ